MPQRRISVRKIREILRLKHENGRSHASIAKSIGVSSSGVGDCLARARRAGLCWPLSDSLDDTALEQKLYPGAVNCLDRRKKETLPNWGEFHQNLKGKGVTRQLLWEEYIAKHPEGYEYSRFCSLYRSWLKNSRISMRQNHQAGEKLFIDYAGQTIKVYDQKTGIAREAQIFVACWGASSYTFAEATWSQKLHDFLGSHVRAFEFFGCVPEVVVPDCLRSAVNKACRYDPDKNQSYVELARHYKVAVIPARPRKPKDKAKVEKAVQVVTRWVLAALRNRKFFSLEELNKAILELLEKLNTRAFQKMPGNRLSTFTKLDKPAAQPLPKSRYVFAEVVTKSVNVDYHICVNDHYYSVPWKLRKKSSKVTVRVTAGTIEILQNNQRVCSHLRNDKKYAYTTVADHMPSNHRAHHEWTPGRMISWGRKIGPNCSGVMEGIFKGALHPEQGYRQCLGILRLERRFGQVRLENACEIANTNSLFRYKHVKSILESGRDKASEEKPEKKSITHANIRGASYYSNLERK